MQRRERNADAPQDLQADTEDDQRTDRAHHLGGDVERKAEALCAEYQQKIRQPAGHGGPHDIAHKFAAHHLMVRLKRQKERRCADGGKGDEGQLQRLERIGQRQSQRHDAEQEREDVLDQKQRGRALDVVDDTPPLGHHAGQGRKIGVEQHQLRDLTGRLRTRCHSNAAVGIF